MKRFAVGLLVLGLLLTTARLALLPLAAVVEAPPPLIGEGQVRLENDTVLRQTVALPTPTPREIAPRIWIQLFPTSHHRLRARLERGGELLEQAHIPLPTLDQAFHRVQLPWWQVPAGASDITVVLEGHGVIVLTTAIDRLAGGNIELNGVSRAPSDLVLQMVSGDRGIDRYLPLSRIAAGKPGVLGWPRMTLLWIALYLAAALLLLAAPVELLRRVLRQNLDSSPGEADTLDQQDPHPNLQGGIQPAAVDS